MQASINQEQLEKLKGRLRNNKHFANGLRAKLLNGYPQESTFVRIVNDLTDMELVDSYFNHVAVNPTHNKIRARQLATIPGNTIPTYVMVADRQA